MDYVVELAPAAERDLGRLPRDLQERLIPHIISLGTDPRPPGCRKLSPSMEGYRIRVGDYRILYAVNDTARMIVIARIAKRDKAYG